jgi:hypothetical protein
MLSIASMSEKKYYTIVQLKKATRTISWEKLGLNTSKIFQVIDLHAQFSHLSEGGKLNFSSN